MALTHFLARRQVFLWRGLHLLNAFLRTYIYSEVVYSRFNWFSCTLRFLRTTFVINELSTSLAASSPLTQRFANSVTKQDQIDSQIRLQTLDWRDFSAQNNYDGSALLPNHLIWHLSIAKYCRTVIAKVKLGRKERRKNIIMLFSYLELKINSLVLNNLFLN